MPDDSNPDSRDQDTAFALPMQGLYADLETGQSFIRLPDDFAAVSSATQIEILAGWRRDLNEQFDQKLLEMFRSVSKAMPGVPAAVRIEGFIATCEGLGIRCSEELVGRLAQE